MAIASEHIIYNQAECSECKARFMGNNAESMIHKHVNETKHKARFTQVKSITPLQEIPRAEEEETEALLNDPEAIREEITKLYIAMKTMRRHRQATQYSGYLRFIIRRLQDRLVQLGERTVLEKDVVFDLSKPNSLENAFMVYRATRFAYRNRYKYLL